MLGVKTKVTGTRAVSEEVAQQYDVVCKEIVKLHGMTTCGWDLLTHDSFVKLCNTNFRNGIIAGVAITGTAVIIHKLATKHESEEE